MRKQVLVAGGGIGGMAAALAASHAGWDVRVFEQAAAFADIGAGVQLGPNVMRRLQAWGLQRRLQEVVVLPEALQARSAYSGELLASLPLGAQMVERYGASYATIHRADLHGLLHSAVAQRSQVFLNSGVAVEQVQQSAAVTTVKTSAGKLIEGDALVVADGVWSGLRAQVLGDASRPRVTGHLAYRALLPMAEVPPAWRSHQVCVWLGPRLHMVQYPVRRGELMNLVLMVEGAAPDDLEHWDHAGNAAGLTRALAGTCSQLQDLVAAVPHWRLWPLADRAPLQGPEQMAQGLVALLGDAAHPMLPYLAQGAGMAIEDAAELQRALAMDDLEVHLRLRRYAINRWQRNARVQARALRNGRIFHATGPVRWGRDLSMRLLGGRLMDVPWLYRGDGSGATSL